MSLKFRVTFLISPIYLWRPDTGQDEKSPDGALHRRVNLGSPDDAGIGVYQVVHFLYNAFSLSHGHVRTTGYIDQG